MEPDTTEIKSKSESLMIIKFIQNSLLTGLDNPKLPFRLKIYSTKYITVFRSRLLPNTASLIIF